jgi:hypothetical protein
MFFDAKSAKTYLVGQIVAQAKRDNIPLSETEEKMLYFSETDWTLPDIQEVSEAFERESNSVEFENKTAELVRRYLAFAREQSPSDLSLWNEAVEVLRKGDHYLLVMVDMAKSPFFPGYREPPSGAASNNRPLQLILAGIGGFLVLAVLMLVFVWHVL